MPARKDPDASANVPSFYGAELRYKREAAGLTLEQLAEGSFRGVPFLSQIERGERRMPLDLARHVDGMLATDGFFERRCEDARKAKQSGHAEYFADVAEMEPFAETIEEWAPMLVPGLLQTPAYALKIIRTGSPWLRPATVEKQVGLRIERAALWEGDQPPAYWAILHESLIRRPLLPPELMADQLEHIAAVVTSVQGVLQILPETATAHPLMMGMVKLMTFPDAPPLAYTEGIHSGQLIDYPGLVKDYRRSYDLLRAAALSPEASLARIEAAAEDFRNGKHRH
ncbi:MULTISPECIES: helix-turn-helix transcriptional regulator [unclassified Streptomyces]|uniref:helix-turn-helix domain-containing protein n=1 Tax=unclassified Streptomyces TaxID=2593676 RepID=UPI001BEA8E43|nr:MULTISPECIES: helix-turn-helix transcriptional regulator [unclassified Streptomyces]MBT2404026.1 helix-turn-helix transcriptional regulator [Streptomyces sp. ISL-21]MBT2607929.1 helix-turn-helix transcriptional regulator [Streptomyces sp. ISL-87]